MKNLIIRTITGAGFVASILASAIWSPEAFVGLFLMVAILGLIEFQRLIQPTKSITTIMPGLLTGIAIYLIISLYAFSIVPAGFLWLILPLSMIFSSVHIFTNSKDALKWIATDISGIAYIVVPLALLNLLLNPEHIPEYHSPWFVVGTLIILWTHDTFAYLCGSMFGKHPLYKAISPKKSWEGSIGGFGFALIAAYVISIYSPQLDTWHWIMIAFIVTVFGTIGDLTESLLKRKAGVKDSGKILPGHGGILDRFDSLFFIAPIVLVFILLCGI